MFISIHAPAKGATVSTTLYASATNTKFQSTLPRRERLCNFRRMIPGSQFQSTLPRRERRFSSLLPGAVYSVFQSTLPRRERLDHIRYEAHRIGISIHAPAKGATAASIKISNCSPISIHAPAKGATKRLTQRCIPDTFQSTLPRRERRLLPRISASPAEFQSTLPRRERPDIRRCVLWMLYFNPRSREGSDSIY